MTSYNVRNTEKNWKYRFHVPKMSKGASVKLYWSAIVEQLAAASKTGIVTDMF